MSTLALALFLASSSASSSLDAADHRFIPPPPVSHVAVAGFGGGIGCIVGVAAVVAGPRLLGGFELILFVPLAVTLGPALGVVLQDVFSGRDVDWSAVAAATGGGVLAATVGVLVSFGVGMGVGVLVAGVTPPGQGPAYVPTGLPEGILAGAATQLALSAATPAFASALFAD